MNWSSATSLSPVNVPSELVMVNHSGQTCVSLSAWALSDSKLAGSQFTVYASRICPAARGGWTFFCVSAALSKARRFWLAAEG